MRYLFWIGLFLGTTVYAELEPAVPPIEIRGEDTGPEKVVLERPHRPPVEAVEACAKKKRNADCVFLGKGPKDNTVSRIRGYCWSPNPKTPLACQPNE